MNKRASPSSLSPEEREAWRRHNLQTLAESSVLPFEEKLAILEDLEELTIAMGYERDPSTVSANSNCEQRLAMNLRKRSTCEEFERALAQCKPEDLDGHTEFYRFTPEQRVEWLC